MTTLPEHYHSTDSVRSHQVSFTPDEVDFLRCAINKLIRAGASISHVTPEVWGLYRNKLEELREHIRIGPPDERSQGL